MIICLAVISFILGINSIALANNNDADTDAPQPQTAIGEFEEIMGKTKMGGGEALHELSNVEPGANIITSSIFKLIDFVKYILGAIAVVLMIMSGLNMITAGTKIDEVSQKEKENLKFIIYGLIFVIIADELVTKVFFGDYGECIASASNAAQCAKQGSGLVKGIYSFVLAIIASFSIMVSVISAFRLVTSAGNEEIIKKERGRIIMAVIGLVIAGFGEFAIKSIVFREGGTKGIDIAAAQKLVYNLTNFVAAFIGASCFVMLFYGGYLYVLSAGNDEKTGKAKKIIMGAIIGLLIALAAYSIVTTFTTFKSSSDLTLPQKIPSLK